MAHIPVLLKEVLEYLNPKTGENFVDATVGDGGHALEIFKKVLPGGKVLGIDWDEEAIKNLKQRVEGFVLNGVEGLGLDTGSISNPREGVWEPEPPQRSGIEPRPFGRGDFEKNLILKSGNYTELKKFVLEAGLKNIKGVLFDFGFRTYQLEESGRGFSYFKDEPLDMRYSLGTRLTAREIINRWNQKELERIFTEYGEERHARKISESIIKSREKKEIKTTGELVEILNKSYRTYRSYSKIFQALRIAVNNELENISMGLAAAWEILSPGGRIAAVSFHSLEDRAVKNFFLEKKKDGLGEVITKKPVGPLAEEEKSNPKSRSAKLRVVRKIKN